MVGADAVTDVTDGVGNAHDAAAAAKKAEANRKKREKAKAKKHAKAEAAAPATRALSDVGKSSKLDIGKAAIKDLISQLAEASQTDRASIDEGSIRLWIMEHSNNSAQEKWAINLHADLIVLGTKGRLEVAAAAAGWPSAEGEAGMAAVNQGNVAIFEKAGGPWLFRVAEGFEAAHVIVVSIQECIST